MYDMLKLDVPIENNLVQKLVQFWEDTFECSFASIGKVIAGSEVKYNKDVLFLVMDGEKPAASCRLTISLSNPELALLGDVATSPAYRGQGLAKKICTWAVDEFKNQGGSAIFLATSNPAAAMLYTSMGWHRLANSNVMLNTLTDATPEEYMVDLYRIGKDLPIAVSEGTASGRVTIVPLLLTPLDQDILDWNTSLRSVRYDHQPSCEGLYIKYEELMNKGVWYKAQRSDGVLAGISSAAVDEKGSICVEAFAHPYYESLVIGDLYNRAIKWAKSQNSLFYTTCKKNDLHKKKLIADLTNLDVQIKE